MLVFDRPNDFMNMCVHHIATLSLLWMSYLPSDCWKIGSAVLLIHEIGDVTISLTKTVHYAQYELASNLLFVLHIIVWMWSRLMWYPRIILSLFTDSEMPSDVWQKWPCGILLCVLLCLHIFWTYLMFKVLYKAVVKKEKLRDDRDREIEEKEDGKDVVVVEMEAGRTENVTPKLHRRRSSLMGSFIIETETERDLENA